MGKNEQYVGVDEKYIPDDEKNSSQSSSAKDEIKNDAHNFYKGVKDSFAGDTDQEKMQNLGRNSVKLAKTFAKGYIILWIVSGIIGFIMLVVVIIFLFNVFSQANRFMDDMDGIRGGAVEVINEAKNNIHYGSNH